MRISLIKYGKSAQYFENAKNCRLAGKPVVLAVSGGLDSVVLTTRLLQVWMQVHM
jgi:tRNA(Ile)-lysidine synthase TilS/MesJ